jgi:hypothetical protein
MIDSEQLNTTVADQKQRLQTVLNKDGVQVPLITSKEYFDQ